MRNVSRETIFSDTKTNATTNAKKQRRKQARKQTQKADAKTKSSVSHETIFRLSGAVFFIGSSVLWSVSRETIFDERA